MDMQSKGYVKLVEEVLYQLGPERSAADFALKAQKRHAIALKVRWVVYAAALAICVYLVVSLALPSLGWSGKLPPGTTILTVVVILLINTDITNWARRMTLLRPIMTDERFMTGLLDMAKRFGSVQQHCNSVGLAGRPFIYADFLYAQALREKELSQGAEAQHSV